MLQVKNVVYCCNEIVENHPRVVGALVLHLEIILCSIGAS